MEAGGEGTRSGRLVGPGGGRLEGWGLEFEVDGEAAAVEAAKVLALSGPFRQTRAASSRRRLIGQTGLGDGDPGGEEPGEWHSYCTDARSRGSAEQAGVSRANCGRKPPGSARFRLVSPLHHPLPASSLQSTDARHDTHPFI